MNTIWDPFKFVFPEAHLLKVVTASPGSWQWEEAISLHPRPPVKIRVQGHLCWACITPLWNGTSSGISGCVKGSLFTPREELGQWRVSEAQARGEGSTWGRFRDEKERALWQEEGAQWNGVTVVWLCSSAHNAEYSMRPQDGQHIWHRLESFSGKGPIVNTFWSWPDGPCHNYSAPLCSMKVAMTICKHQCGPWFASLVFYTQTHTHTHTHTQLRKEHAAYLETHF
jgi:hypothetical protein